MTSAELLIDTFGRVRASVHQAVDGLGSSELSYRPDADANSIAWLIWHLTRIQDDHIAGVAGTEQRWTAKDWQGRFGLPFDPAATGYGDGPDEVAALATCSAENLTGYHDEVYVATVDYLGTLTDSDLDLVVDRNWDPPVTLGVRLVSVVVDALEHVGQATYLRGVAGRR